MMKAVFLSKGDLTKVYTPELRAKLAEKLEFLPDAHSIENGNLKDVDFIFSTWGMLTPDAETIKRELPNLKAVFYGAGSVQYFAKPFLELGITVVSAWAANGVPVAEFTTAQIVLANKGFFHRNRRKVAHVGNYGAKVGIIGAGMIGKLVINMLKAYKLDVYVFDPFLPDEKAAELGVVKTSLEYIFSSCDVISNHLANNPQTVGMLSGRLFDTMKSNAVFINTGRGAQVVEADLIAALKAEPNRFALLDVTYPEPPVDGSELYTLDNVWLSPHIAGSLGYEVQRMGEYMYDEYLAYSENRPLKYAVTMKMLETMA